MQLKEKRRSGRPHRLRRLRVEQLQEVAQPIAPLPFTQRFDLALLDRALAQLQEVQTVGKLTGCTHAAARIQPDGALSGGCEDVGRHVALDKLLGYRSQQAWLQGRRWCRAAPAMKWCKIRHVRRRDPVRRFRRHPPAVEVAERSNLTLVGFSKPGRATVYTHPQRLWQSTPAA